MRGLRGIAIFVLFIGAVAVAGCGGTSVDINPRGPQARVKWGTPPDKKKPDGVVILLHGGGWQPNRFAYEDEMPLAASLRKQGHATVVVGYDAGAKGFQEIENVYAKVRKRYPGMPICVHGISAGGNLALMLAAREPDIRCVVSLLGPTDLTTLKDQGGKMASDLAVTAFGQDGLADFSPVRFANQIRAHVLGIYAQTDPVVPIAQAHELVRARPQTELFVIPPGSTPVDWLHNARVTPEGAQEAVTRGLAFIRQQLREG